MHKNIIKNKTENDLMNYKSPYREQGLNLGSAGPSVWSLHVLVPPTVQRHADRMSLKLNAFGNTCSHSNTGLKFSSYCSLHLFI